MNGQSRILMMTARRASSVLCSIAGLILLSGCATTSTIPQMAWVRTDGRRIADDPALLQQGKSDIAVCNADADTGTPNNSARGCMASKGLYVGAPRSGRRRARSICCRCPTRRAEQMTIRCNRVRTAPLQQSVLILVCCTLLGWGVIHLRENQAVGHQGVPATAMPRRAPAR